LTALACCNAEAEAVADVVEKEGSVNGTKGNEEEDDDDDDDDTDEEELVEDVEESLMRSGGRETEDDEDDDAPAGAIEGSRRARVVRF
jgi:hypothetical protein